MSPEKDKIAVNFESEHDLTQADENEHQQSSGGPTGIVERETRLVNRSKWLVYIVILLSAAVAGIVTFFFMQAEEERWIQDEFEEFAEEVFESTRVNLEKLDEAIRALSQTVTSYTLHNTNANGTVLALPFVTLPDFAVAASNFVSLGNAKSAAIAPLVLSTERFEWEAYAVDHQGWIQEDWETAVLEGQQGLWESGHDADFLGQEGGLGSIQNSIYGVSPAQDPTRHLPIWQIYPTPVDAFNSPVMRDLLGMDWIPPLLEELQETRHHVFSSIVDLDPLLDYHDWENEDSDDGERDESSLDHDRRRLEEGATSPQSVILEPIFDSYDNTNGQIVGVALAIIEWNTLFSGLLEDEAAGMIFDLQYSCPATGTASPRYSFRTTADENTLFVGENYVHDPQYDYLTEHGFVSGGMSHGSSSDEDSDDRRGLEEESDDSDEEEHSVVGCVYHVSIHATEEFIGIWATDDKIVYPIVVCSIFVFTGLVFLLYDLLVQTRNRKVVRAAERSTAIVTSLFPKKVAEQMLEENIHAPTPRRSSTVQALKAISAPTDDDQAIFSVAKTPIAELFKEATIMFADIAGFTAWSSMREPTQVFKLLETIFNAFDEIADRRNVFKVETVGDCYVAVCGVPDPRRDHAVVMARFARDCLLEIARLTSQLDVELGPDTSNLSMRFGLHSGAVTAGVLRGQRARFQLFGDAVNKASRIETSGSPGKIHLSKETADHLIDSGKGHWVAKRSEMVNLKGLGHVTTYWLQIMSELSVVTVSDTRSCTSVDSGPKENQLDDVTSEIARRGSSTRMASLISWHTEVLSQFLCKIIANRDQLKQEQQPSSVQDMAKMEEEALSLAEVQAVFGKASPSTSMSFPVLDNPVDGSSVVLDETVLTQLSRFVEEIAAAYNPNPFHNFQHASHVVMSVTKLLSHMESTSNISLDDPMTQFAAVFTALIHDVDHPGVPNGQLIKEGHDLTKMYTSSIAERNSLDVAWSILSQSAYRELRRTIYQTVEEFERFRELLVHSVLVTDLMDKGLQNERKKRWDDVFAATLLEESERHNNEGSDDDSAEDMVNKQKMALLEHVIQTSDVAHTMQHWSVYQHWNRCLYQELKEAYEGNRAQKDPSQFWYQGEIGFFDFYIIPLAQRLKDCPAFDASGQELLQYANSNRTEWEMKGNDVVDSWK